MTREALITKLNNRYLSVGAPVNSTNPPIGTFQLKSVSILGDAGGGNVTTFDYYFWEDDQGNGDQNQVYEKRSTDTKQALVDFIAQVTPGTYDAATIEAVNEETRTGVVVGVKVTGTGINAVSDADYFDVYIDDQDQVKYAKMSPVRLQRHFRIA